MSWRKNAALTLRASLLSSALLVGCASSLPPTLPAVAPPLRIPSAPVVSEPPPSGTFWARHCALLLNAQERLKTSLEGSERCNVPGPATH
jgi:hypothetical protein